MGRNNNPTRGSTIRHVVRTIAAASAAAATLVAGMLVAGTADAADMRDPFERSIQNGNPGLWANLGTITFSNGAKYEGMMQTLGVVDKVNGKNAYCIQADVLYTGTTGTWGEWTDAKTKPDAQRLAWLTDKYNGNTDDLTQAAIAGLIHQKLDPMGNEYLSGIQRLGWKDGTSWDTYTKKMNELWNEAVANTPSNLDMRYQYTIGKRKGTIDVGIQNGNGGFLSGITYTATLKGPAVFDQTGKNTISGTTTNSAQHVAWTATGNGKVMPVFNYKVPKAAKLSSPNQNLMAATDPETVSQNIQFEVRRLSEPCRQDIRQPGRHRGRHVRQERPGADRHREERERHRLRQPAGRARRHLGVGDSQERADAARLHHRRLCRPVRTDHRIRRPQGRSEP